MIKGLGSAFRYLQVSVISSWDHLILCRTFFSEWLKNYIALHIKPFFLNKHSWSQTLNLKFHISFIVRSVSGKLGVLYRLSQFFFQPDLLTIYKGLALPCMEYASHMGEESFHTAVLDRVESKDVRSISSPPFNNCFSFIFFHLLYANCSSELAKCVFHSRGLTA